MDVSRLLRITAQVAAQKDRRDLEWWSDCCHDPPDEDKPKYWKRDIPNKVYTDIVTSQRKPVIIWVKPNIEEEEEGFQRAAKELGLDIEDMNQKASKGWTQQISKEIWSILQNTDSWTVESIEDVEKIAAKNNKDLEFIVSAIGKGQSLPSPIVVFLGDGIPYLIAGNTRLMVSKMMGVTPEVFFFDLANSGKANEMALFDNMETAPSRADR